MPMLPSHQEVHYEPLGKPSSSHTNNTTTVISKLANRRLILGLVLIGVLGTLTFTKIYHSNEYSINNNKEGTNRWQSWTGGASKTFSDSVMKFEAAAVQQPAIPACSVAPPSQQPSPVFTSLPQATKAVEMEHHFSEEDWHMPSDVHLLDSDPLWVSRRRPYFTQVKGDVHRELGFGTQTLKLTEAPFVRRSLYRHLLQSFNSFALQHDFHFWLAHGSLLGQYWGQKIMTGDTDIDVQCSLGDLHRVRQYEQTLWEDRFELVVNPHYLIRKTRNSRGLGLDKNVIDARWIDVLTGYYIDITALSALQADRPLTDVGPFLEPEEGRQAMMIQDKSPHKYDLERINPTRRCQFEGMSMWCPNKMNDILEEEYHSTYNHPQFHTWRFNTTIQAFNEVSCPQLLKMYQFPNVDNCDQECKEVVKHNRTLHWSALVMTGDIRKIGCLLKVIFKDQNGKDGSTFREYWGREDPNDKVKLRNTNITHPGIIL